MINKLSHRCCASNANSTNNARENQHTKNSFQRASKRQLSNFNKPANAQGSFQNAQRFNSNSAARTNFSTQQYGNKPNVNLNLQGNQNLTKLISNLQTLIAQFQSQIGNYTPPAPVINNNVISINVHGGNVNVTIQYCHTPSTPTNPNPPQQTFAKPDAGEVFNRLAPADYERSEETGLPAPRDISNAVSNQNGAETSNANGASDLLWSWGQFLDHDITLSEEGEEKSIIAVPKGDPGLDPTGTGQAFIPFTKSHAEIDENGVAQQVNKQTPLIDASMVYGTSKEQTDGMREFSGGRMKLDDGFLPASNDKNLVLAGDPRAAEQPGLLSLQTLFVREHNRLAEIIKTNNPLMSDEQIFQQARSVVAAEVQAITYNEFLPVLIGGGNANYAKHHASTGENDGKVSNEFATAAYRLGHTLVSETVAIKNADGTLSQASLDEVFFQPEFTKEKGIAAILSGQSEQTAEKVDPMIVDGLRDRLFGGPGSPGLDLASINIERGRDHGIASYNDMRETLGMPKITSFDDPIFQDGVGEKLASVYNSPDDIDLWVGGLAEKPIGSSMLGQTFTTIVADQFAKTASADASFYTRSFTGADKLWLDNLTLSDVIRANTENVDIDDTAFYALD